MRACAATAHMAKMHTRLAALLAILSACVTPGPAQHAGAPAVDPSPAPPLPAAQPAAVTEPITAPGPGEWQTWSRAQRMAYMKGPFMEEERKIFASWLPVRFRDMECRTCHGTVGVANGSFRMPNPDLPIVAPGPDGFQELAEHETVVLKFMQQKLVPETARLLGMEPFDMKTHRGFSCYQCHVRGQ
jgi:hypothetical protein